jgi:hypothetical protein
MYGFFKIVGILPNKHKHYTVGIYATLKAVAVYLKFTATLDA